jgi:hypothetical protein
MRRSCFWSVPVLPRTCTTVDPPPKSTQAPMIRTAWPVLVLAACATAPAAEEPRQLSGHYRFGFELEAFRPCGELAEWWVTRTDELRARALDVPGGSERVYAVVRAHVSPEGTYGHLGAYPRQLSVVEILEVREATDADCRP